VSEKQREEAKTCRDKVGGLAPCARGYGHRSLRKAAHNEESPKQAAQNVCWPMCNQLLVRINVTAALQPAKTVTPMAARISRLVSNSALRKPEKPAPS
jgi:hypothetical protein